MRGVTSWCQEVTVVPAAKVHGDDGVLEAVRAKGTVPLRFGWQTSMQPSFTRKSKFKNWDESELQSIFKSDSAFTRANSDSAKHRYSSPRWYTREHIAS